MRKLKAVATVAVCAGLTAGVGTAQAALHARSGGMIFDDVRNLTWLADLNYAKTSGYHQSGRMSWETAKAWAENLSYGGFDDWRLPTLNPSDESCSFSSGGKARWGYDCTGGELSHLFVTDLGNKGNESVLNQTGDTELQKANLALFSHVQTAGYWSGTKYAPGTTGAWYFVVGTQFYDGNFVSAFAVAVRPGDVAAVPEPQALALLLAGLGAVAVAVRQRPR